MILKTAGWLVKSGTLIVAAVTAIAAWASLFNPQPFWPVSLLGLSLPFLFIINLFFVFWWAMARSKMVLIPVAALLLTLVRLPLIYQSGNEQQIEEETTPKVKVLSFNVRLFDWYNWSKNKETRRTILEFLENQSADIYCFQEFFTSDRPGFNNFASVQTFSKIRHAHTEYPIRLYGTDYHGMATFSRHPIVGKGKVDIETGSKSTNMCLFTDIKIGQDTIRIYNFHLQSVRLDVPDYKFIEELGQNPEEADKVSRTRNILRRLKNGNIKRARQAELIAQHIKTSPYPVIVCGDMNDTPLSYTYSLASEGLNDAFRESGSGFGFTYAGPIPGLRIDYIFHSPEMNSSGFTTWYHKFSDHYPISTEIFLKK